MKTLFKKAIRELYNSISQSITIALVVASGVAVLVAALNTYSSLIKARDKFYITGKLADAFATCKRAPVSLAERLKNVEGVSFVETRIIREALLDRPDEEVSSSAKFVSLPNYINRLHVLKGNFPETDEEALVSIGFAEANLIGPGDSVSAILDGKKVKIRITGIALSPEFIYAMRGANPLPDDRHFGIFWMKRSALESYFGMQETFNDLVFLFAPDIIQSNTIHQIDEILAPFGASGAYSRDKLPSHMFLKDEFRQLKATAWSMPIIFLGVAAFLLHVVASRLVQRQREQIATLKALGYGRFAIGLHYFTILGGIGFAGSVSGIIIGLILGTAWTRLYGEYYRLPNLEFSSDFNYSFLGFCIGMISALFGSQSAVKSVVKLEPAQAMRPPVPIYFGTGVLENILKKFSAQNRMILRTFLFKKKRFLLGSLGISSAILISITGLFWKDAVFYMMDTEFNLVTREDVSIFFFTPVPYRAVQEIENLPEVFRAEGYRIVPVKFRNGARTYESAIQGYSEDSHLRKILSKENYFIQIPKNGIILNEVIAKKLEVKTGDSILAEVLEGNRPKLNFKVTGVISEILGMGAYTDFHFLHSSLGQEKSLTFISLQSDKNAERKLLEKIKKFPKTYGVFTRSSMLRGLREVMERSVLISALILGIFASVISVGVIYNTMIVSLSEKSWELASLRILGLTRREVFWILVSELILQIIIAIPIGCVLGYWFSWLLMQTTSTEAFQIPLIILPATYITSVGIALIASFVSFYILWRKVKTLDLISVLKLRE
ncbi:MAG TPA: FtsX-like permease family protein [Leptospiraceae bacterium]|nr:FtsX-like permease family protein [Leptospiraceae bacterium]HMW06242.1 FtsX-like permease family protein [Leptospiraceae bacterium]HMX34953.1 FtsX-like permease family protein [Leptospiraceae bacterium]HMY31704.1 FtsX-like permease family protein [Leptospiraceae bacterium]HMZ65769.1 FtsX-like permease family protein [Leptospiraceae bacterium]